MSKKQPTYIEAARLAIDRCGGASKLSRDLGVMRERVQAWKRIGVPRDYTKAIAHRSGIPIDALLPELEDVS